MTYLSYTSSNVYIYTDLLVSCNSQAKPRKKAKKDKPANEPILKEPKLQTAAPEASVAEPSLEPAHEPPTSTTDPPADQATDGSANLEVSSPVKTDDPQDADVEITKANYIEIGRPTVLAKCSAKEELLECRQI